MKQSWNWRLWVGFVCTLAGFLTYPFLVRFPVTRDFPWVNFLLFAVGAVLLVAGLKRAVGQPERYRGRVFGSIFAGLGLLVFAFFSYIVFYELKHVPASQGAPEVGQKAPDFSLPNQDGEQIALADLVSSKGSGGKPAAALLIFYRGFW